MAGTATAVRVAGRVRPVAAWVTVTAAGAAAGAAGLFLAYLRMSRQVPVDADGAGNVLQAWDLLHGNWLLRGWTVSDVSFFTTELPQYALVALVRGLDPDVVHLAAAMTYTLLVLLAAALAGARGGAWGAGLAVAVLAVPDPDGGARTLLLSPDHTGTGVPLLVTWLVLDRTRAAGGRPPRWLPATVAVLLAWGQLGDPLLLFVGVVPLLVVCVLRLWRDGRPWADRLRSLDGSLLLAGIGSVVLVKGVLLVVRLLGGFAYFSPPVQVAPPGRWGHNLSIAVTALGVLFDTHGPLAVVHLVGVLTALGAVGLVAWHTVRGGPGTDRVDAVAAVGVLVNLAAFVASTAPVDAGSARQIAPVLPLGAVLVGRVWGPRLARTPWRAVLVAVVAASALVLTTQAPAGQTVNVPPALVDSLRARGLTYGLGGYWNANNVTLATGGRVVAVPVQGRGPVLAYHWESRADWYDPTRHDARFLLLDGHRLTADVEAAAGAQFGPPVERYAVAGVVVLRYDRNLLVDLRAG